MPRLVDHKNRKRLVIIGVGANCALGRTWPEAWKGLAAGQGGITRNEDRLPPERFLSSYGGFVKGFGPASNENDERLSRLDARFLHLGLAAAEEAIQVLKGKEFDPERAAVVATSAFGGVDLQDNDRVKAEARGRLQIGPFTVPGLLINQLGGQISQHLGLYGPGFSPSNACASGGHAIITAALLLRADMADIALCGAAESAFVPSIYNAFYTMKALAAFRPEDRASSNPGQASRPFSIDRTGFVMSEGAGMLVIATLEQALKLQVPILAELVGLAVNSDGYHMAAPLQPRIEKCLAGAMADGGITPDSVGYYNAHGTSTPVNDATETAAVKAVFGEHAAKLPISSIKGAIGHTLGAASAIEAITTIESLRSGVIVPTINYVSDPALDLDYVPGDARESFPTYALSASFGFGGTNNALVFRRFDDEALDTRGRD